MQFRPPYPHQLPDPGVLGYAQAVEAYLARLRTFYNSRAVWHRRFYRSSGILVILIGAGLPLVASLSYPEKDLTVSLLGVLIAALTAMRAFYRWDQSWILLRATERGITSAWWDYQAKVAAIVVDGDEARAKRERDVAARELVTALLALRDEEAEGFFADMSFPSTRD